MLNCRIKYLLKIVCYVSAVVIICYFGRKHGLNFSKNEKSEMSSLRIISAEFEVFGVVQGKLTEIAYAGSKLNLVYFLRCFLQKGKM